MSFSFKIIISLLIIAIIFLAVFYYTKTIQPITIKENEVSEDEDLKLKKEIGQMVMIGFRGTNTPKNSFIVKTIRDLDIGGVILFDHDVPSNSFPRNILNPVQTKQLIADLQSYAPTPLFISVDAEGGSVNRLKEAYGFLAIPSAQEMGKDKTLNTTKKESELLVQELKSLGFNMNFAPVADVNTNPKNPIIGALGRSFSADPKVVVNNARVFIKSSIEHNIIPVEKHFPGHGSSTSDSHLGIVDITNTYQKKELDPYIQLQKEGLLDAVMTAHIMNRNIDPNYPATLSYEFLQKILRKQIEFKGVIISDDMQMNAIINQYGFGEAIIRAINAGCDILLLSNNGTAAYDEQLPYKAIDVIYNAVKDSAISKERIRESHDRILNLKKKFKIL